MKITKNQKNSKSYNRFKMILLWIQTFSISKKDIKVFLMMKTKLILLLFKIKNWKMKLKNLEKDYLIKAIWKKKICKENNKFLKKEKILLQTMKKDKVLLINNCKIWKTNLLLKILMIFSALNKTKKYLIKIFLRDCNWSFKIDSNHLKMISWVNHNGFLTILLKVFLHLKRVYNSKKFKVFNKKFNWLFNILDAITLIFLK